MPRSLLTQVLDDMEDEYNLTMHQREVIEKLVQPKTQAEIAHEIGSKHKEAVTSIIQYITRTKMKCGGGRETIVAEVIKRMEEKVAALIGGAT